MKFSVYIQLGNDAMQTAADIADTLDKISEELRIVSGPPLSHRDQGGSAISDANGNRVGAWKITQ